MDAQPAVVTVKFNKFLPYWAVLQTDLRQTFHSWVYRLWVFMAVLAAGGLLLYRVGVHKEAGMFQSAAAQCGNDPTTRDTHARARGLSRPRICHHINEVHVRELFNQK